LRNKNNANKDWLLLLKKKRDSSFTTPEGSQKGSAAGIKRDTVEGFFDLVKEITEELRIVELE
jgi:hypothetical protein